MKNILILFALFCFTILGNLHAQTEADEAGIKAFTEKFVKAFNSQDVEAIKKMYTDDAVRIDTEGNKMEGADKIAAHFKDSFIKNNVTLKVEHKSLNWSDAEHAFIAGGTYEVKGAQVVYDIEIHDTGKYSNTMIKEKGGEWKIAKSVLTVDDEEGDD